MFLMQTEFRAKLHSLRADYHRVRPALDLIARIVDNEIKQVTRFTHKPALSESRIKSLDSMRLKFVDEYEKINTDIEISRLRGSIADTRAKQALLQRFLESPLPFISDVIGLRYVTLYNYNDFRDRINNCFRSSTIDDHGVENWVFDYSPNFVGKTEAFRKMAQHLIARLGPAQVQAAISLAQEENLDVSSDFLKTMPFEIQLRSPIVHAWAVISHERSYKLTGKESVAEEMSDLVTDALSLQKAFDKVGSHEELWLKKLMRDLSRSNVNGGQYMFRDKAIYDKLMALPCTDPEALAAYAMYKFYDAKFYGRESNEVSPLWISLCARYLHLTTLKTIGDLESHIDASIDEVIQYRDTIKSTHSNIFKDATDWLSKCLIFSLEPFQTNYPYGKQTESELIRLKKISPTSY